MKNRKIETILLFVVGIIFLLPDFFLGFFFGINCSFSGGDWFFFYGIAIALFILGVMQIVKSNKLKSEGNKTYQIKNNYNHELPEKLQKIDELHKNGGLSDEEYEKMKNEILNS